MGAGAGIPVPLTGPDDQALDSAEAWRRAMPARVRDRWDKSAREIAESWAPEGAMPPEVVELLAATFAACNTRAVAIVDAYLRS